MDMWSQVEELGRSILACQKCGLFFGLGSMVLSIVFLGWLFFNNIEQWTVFLGIGAGLLLLWASIIFVVYLIISLSE